ncbi:hypothetical protein ONZ45_g605 [Pleurotus djamor]|nr:hypothetical protein ONZ45_g605 [Pleurotus djamor]
MSRASQIKLQAPPNVDFVQGYPGIPPGPDRPQASVQGALEVRAPQGVKAKWVTIELRKVEILPGGGTSNTYYDSVPGPVKLWSSKGEPEYEMLQSQDFPFNIRIPESIPATLQLDRTSGIRYELIGTVCLKGSKGFLRRRKEVISSTTANITLDKHELHSTWPVYCQHEVRQAINDGCIIAVAAMLKSDRTGTVILRGYEMALVETLVLTTAHTSTKRAVQHQQESIITECKLPVNVTMYGGVGHQAELRCVVPTGHINSTVNSARHLDITYTLSIKAHLSTGAQVAMRLPVVVSRWPREYSAEAVKLIGPAPGLSLTPITSNPIRQTIDIHPGAVPSSPVHQTYAGRPAPQQTDAAFGRGGTFAGFNSPSMSNMRMDEFGRPSPQITATESTSNPSFNRPAATATVQPTPETGRRPPSARAGGSANRYTITNALPSEIPQDDEPTHQRNNSYGVSPKKKPNRAWPSAEEEKQKLYEQAKAQVERSQSGVTRVTTPPPQNASPAPSEAASLPTSPKKWPTAEEEKRRFEAAQAAVQRAQYGTYSPPPPAQAQSESKGSSSSSSNAVSPAARMYSQAMSSRNVPPTVVTPNTKSSPTIPSQAPPAAKNQPASGIPQYRSAEEEKAALRRYHEARDAVNKTQNMTSPQAQNATLDNESTLVNPIAYEALYPAGDSGSSSQPPPPVDDLPPSFDATVSGAKNILSEKERLRRNYEAQDAAARAQIQAENGVARSPPPPPRAESPPPFSAAQDPISRAKAEKERLRRFYAEQDALAAAPAASAPPTDSDAPPYVESGSSVRPTPTPPPRTNGTNSRSRPHPKPPGGAPSSRLLTAAEEKALLRARYEADNASARSESPQSVYTHRSNTSPPPPPSSSPPPPSFPPSAPPPLMPRPPLEYIQETREEDARVSRIAGNGNIFPLLDEPPPPPRSMSVGIDLRPFTPFGTTFEPNGIKAPGPPPPLPHKPAGE